MEYPVKLAKVEESRISDLGLGLGFEWTLNTMEENGEPRIEVDEQEYFVVGEVCFKL